MVFRESVAEWRDLRFNLLRKSGGKVFTILIGVDDPMLNEPVDGFA